MKRIYLLMTMGYLFTLSLLTACHSDDVSPPILMDPLEFSGYTFNESDITFSCNGKVYNHIYVTFDSIPEKETQMNLNIYGLQRHNFPITVDITPKEKGFTFNGSFQHPYYEEFELDVKGVYGTVEDSSIKRSGKLIDIVCNYKVSGYNKEDKSIVFRFDQQSLFLQSLGGQIEGASFSHIQNKLLPNICERIGHHTTALKFFFREDGHLDLSIMPTDSNTFIPYMTVEYWPNFENSLLLNLSFTEEQAEQFMEDWLGKPNAYSPPFYTYGDKRFMTICVWQNELGFSWLITGNYYYWAWSMFLRANAIKGLEGKALEEMQQMYNHLWDAYSLEKNLQDFSIPSKFRIIMHGEWKE